MKNLLIMLLLATAIALPSIAQDTPADNREKLHVGVKVGLDYSNVYDSQGDAFKPKATLGFAAGIFASIPIGKYIGIQPEILFAQKGFKATGRILGANYDFTRTTDYIDVPVFFAIKPVEFVTILAGPQFSYLIKTRDTFAGGTTTLEQQQEVSNGNIRKNTLCFVGGLDFNIKYVVISLRAGWDMLKNNGDGTSTTPRYKNVWTQATLGFRI